jgi:hypothetical protein
MASNGHTKENERRKKVGLRKAPKVPDMEMINMNDHNSPPPTAQTPRQADKHTNSV